MSEVTRPGGPRLCRYFGGQRVRPGHYWNLRTGELVAVRREDDALPGGPNVRYLRTPPLAVVLLGPTLGGVYVLALPILGFAAVVKLGIATAGAMLLAGPRWLPGRAYLLGWASRRRTAGEPPASNREKAKTWLKELEDEIRERRKKEEK
ncbi:MAG: hypothetical protein Q8O40_10960 [Chloroflexota bacterium]|nr:hypothetical protein [Chloroflexota bacterium]